MRFDDAVAEYQRVYQLAYKDAQWMEKVAEVRARQGKTDDVVAALKDRFDRWPTRRAPANIFEAARRLESWGMLTPAQTFADQGVRAAGTELLATP